MRIYEGVQLVLLLVSIVIAIATVKVIGNKVENEKGFDGGTWGLINGVAGLGILWVIMAHASINKKIALVKHKEYTYYANAQMKEFVKAYGICIIVWIVIDIITLATGLG